MRKRPVSRTWLYAAGVIVVIAALSWVQFSIKSLGNELEQSNADRSALADQVRSLGGQPVAEGKPGARGDQGPMGPQGPQGIPGPQGIQGPIGVTGESPQCLLMPSKCVGPKGATGGTGTPGKPGEEGAQGPQGLQGESGPAGAAGPQGPAGPEGDQGPAGPDGPQGPAGPAGPDTSAEKCAAMTGVLQELTVTTGPLTQAKILVCVLK